MGEKRQRPLASPGQNLPSLQYRRIVVKAGTNVLTGGGDRPDEEVMASLVGQMAHLHARGAEVVLVTSGAIAAGRQHLNLSQEDKGVSVRQVLAAAGQSHLMHVYQQLFSRYSIAVAQALLTRHDLTDRLGYLNIRNTLTSLLDLRVIPVVNENDVVAVEEIGEKVFGDNDTLSALVANLVDADLLVMLTDTEGLYTADPHRATPGHLIRRVERVDKEIEALAGRHYGSASRGGMATKLEAAKLVTASGVAAVIAKGSAAEVVVRLAQGEEIGTFFVPTATRMESRKRWMLSGLSSRGEIQVDNGAVRALQQQKRSLLAAGVQAVRGQFQRGDIVSIVDGEGHQIAWGIANYDAQDLEGIKGAHSDRIEELLGHDYGDEVVHRNNMAVLEQ